MYIHYRIEQVKTTKSGDKFLETRAKKFKATVYGPQASPSVRSNMFGNNDPKRLISPQGSYGRRNQEAAKVNGLWNMARYENGVVSSAMTIKNVYFDSFGKIHFNY